MGHHEGTLTFMSKNFLLDGLKTVIGMTFLFLTTQAWATQYTVMEEFTVYKSTQNADGRVLKEAVTLPVGSVIDVPKSERFTTGTMNYEYSGQVYPSSGTWQRGVRIISMGDGPLSGDVQAQQLYISTRRLKSQNFLKERDAAPIPTNEVVDLWFSGEIREAAREQRYLMDPYITNGRVDSFLCSNFPPAQEYIDNVYENLVDEVIEVPSIFPRPLPKPAYSTNFKQPSYAEDLSKVACENAKKWNGTPLHGNKPISKSLGKCYRYTKLALQGAGVVTPYINGLAAKDAAWQMEQDVYGFTNVDDGVASPDNVPLGTVIVYSGGTYGHIEIVAECNGKRMYCSDYCSERPRSGYDRRNGRGRKVIGYMIHNSELNYEE
jgi:hypothetical protein